MKTLYEYDLYYPMTSATGPRSDAIFQRLKERLTAFFGGLTDFHHRSEGAWKFGGVTYHDEVVLLRMLGQDQAKARAFLGELKQELEMSLHEEQVLIIEREVRSL
jgi:hypothetical protein